MKQMFKSFAAICITALIFTACTKDVKETVNNETISDQTLAQIGSLGFGTNGVRKIAEGYLVEGDIILTEQNLNNRPSSPNLVIAQEEQYNTFNLVEGYPRTINVKLSLDGASLNHSNAFNAALDEAISRYNAQGLQLQFQKVTSGTVHITVVAYNENSNTLGSAGFPTTSGEPYSQIKMNTFHYDTGTDPTNVNYIGTIIAHEMGHCIGFRHTDYMLRSYSCGYGGNEGQARNGVGAVHIPGTPKKGDPNSWMLACIGDNVNRPFNDNDKIALDYLY